MTVDMRYYEACLRDPSYFVEDAVKQYLQDNPEIAAKLEADIRRNFDKLMTGQSRVAAKAAGRAVDVSADDFDDAD